MISDDGELAFPATEEHGLNSGAPGMTLRDYFAAKALPIAWDALDKGYFDSDDHNEGLSRAAYQLADAMLKARSE